MATRVKGKKFLELGEILQKWREPEHRSALALFRDRKAKFTFSYSSYADFERGATLPTPEILIELALFFKQDPSLALLTWAKVQMPSREYRQVFDNRGASRSDKAPDYAQMGTPPSFENTWVFGPAELKTLQKHPWLWDLCLILATRYTDEIPFSKMILPEGVTPEKLCSDHLRDWIDRNCIIASETGLKLHYRHIHLPRTSEWEQIRLSNLQRALQNLSENISQSILNEGLAYRELVHRSLTPEQAKRWSAELKKFEAAFKADPYVDDHSRNQTHAFMAVLGPRKLTRI